MHKQGGNDLRKKIQNYSYGLQDFLYEGAGQSVFLGLDEIRSQKVAIRVIDLRRNPSIKSYLESQIDILKRLKHPNILQCLDIFTTVNNCYFVTELCTQGTLQDRIDKRKCFEESQAVDIFKQILNGWLYLLREHIIHGNLNPAHLLLNDRKQIKISGFANSYREGKIHKNKKQFNKFQSPESVKDQIFTYKSDIWSLGMILYVLLHSQFPWDYENESQFLQQCQQPIVFSEELSPYVLHFLKRCLVQQKQRMNQKQIHYEELVQSIQLTPILVPEEINNQKEEYKQKQLSHVIKQTQKQITAHHNWMRFLFRLLDRISSFQEDQESTVIVKFIIARQVLIQYQQLKKALIEGENRLNLKHWKDYAQNRERMLHFGQNIQKNKGRYNKAMTIYNRLLSCLTYKTPAYLKQIHNNKFTLSEYNCMAAIKASLEEIRRMWEIITRDFPLERKYDSTTSFKHRQMLMGIDYLMSYYQLNCILIEDFQRIDYFQKMSKLDLILEFAPVELDASHLPEIHKKLIQLEIIKQ